MRKTHFFTPVLASVILSGCASVETSGLQSGAQGVGYYLPKGKFELTVVDDSGGLSATLAGPVMVADERYPLVTRLPRSGTSDNHVTVTVDPKTNLLSKVDVTSTGDVATIAKSIAKTVAMIQAAGGSSGKTIFDKVYDLTELGDGTAANDVNAFLQQYFAAQCGPATANTMPLGDELTASGYEATVAKADRKTQLLYCRKLSLAGLSTARANTLVTIAVSDRPSPRTAAWRRTDPQTGTAVPDPSFDGGRDCGRGICYRPFRPTRIALEVKGAFSQSGVFLVPDETQTLFVGLPQGAFAEQKYTLTFTEGVLTEYEQNSKSELVGALALPSTSSKRYWPRLARRSDLRPPI